MLKIYNTLTKTKEIFTPITPGKINFYACGVTVYDYCHLGNAKAAVEFDMIVRYLTYLGFDVDYVRNITDIDDKIIKRAQENGEDYKELTARFTKIMHEDLASLGVLLPTQEPRATEFMPQIIAMVQNLVDKGYAYVGKNGDVYYDVRKFKDYGKFSKRDIEQMRSGARIAVSEAKRDPLDFVLWKLVKPGEPSWDSPWGKGRPGWHIECSVMATACLAKHIDIHGGGMDLIFPHHENEIAQAEATTGEKFVNVWMHVGYLQVDKEKMAKSAGNFFTIREVLEKHDPEVVRYFLIASHYRSPLNYSEENLTKARQSLERLYIALRDVKEGEFIKDSEYEKRFCAAMSDDFNTPEAMAVLFDLVREINKLKDTDKVKSNQLAATLKHLGGVLGLLQQEPKGFLQGEQLEDSAAIKKIEEMLTERKAARANKDWQKSDQIRDELLKLGIILEDGPQGTTWRKL
jgi:cysteinyl-tRNA synthetase